MNAMDVIEQSLSVNFSDGPQMLPQLWLPCQGYSVKTSSSSSIQVVRCYSLVVQPTKLCQSHLSLLLLDWIHQNILKSAFR